MTMHLDALLCDSATVREGLLHILGAGITRVWREQYPAPGGFSLAMLLTLQRSEASDRHRIRVLVQDEDGKNIAQVDGEFGVAPGTLSQPGEQLAMPMILNLSNIGIPHAGAYSVEILLDSQLFRSIPFIAGNTPPPARA